MRITPTTWTKLRNGTWGIKGIDLHEGERIKVTKRSGESKTVTVGKVVWHGKDGLAIATVATPARRTTGHRCEECGRSGAHEALDMSGLSGWLCRSCDDGSASFC